MPREIRLARLPPPERGDQVERPERTGDVAQRPVLEEAAAQLLLVRLIRLLPHRGQWLPG